MQEVGASGHDAHSNARCRDRDPKLVGDVALRCSMSEAGRNQRERHQEGARERVCLPLRVFVPLVLSGSSGQSAGTVGNPGLLPEFWHVELAVADFVRHCERRASVVGLKSLVGRRRHRNLKHLVAKGGRGLDARAPVARNHSALKAQIRRSWNPHLVQVLEDTKHVDAADLSQPECIAHSKRAPLDVQLSA